MGSLIGSGSPDQKRPAWLPKEVWPFDLRSIRHEGALVSYTDVGAGPTLLFCHAGMWSFLWRDVILALADRYRCVTFDPPGSGLSQRIAPQGRTLELVRDVIVGLVDTVDLDEVTLVMHDLGGPTALAAASVMPERVAGLAAVNTFGWKPGGVPFRTMLAIFGSAWMRELDAYTGWLPAASTTRFGVGRHLDRAGRRAFRRGMDRDARRTMHLLFRSAQRSEEVYAGAASAVEKLAARPLLTVFGTLGDYLRFRPKWRTRFGDVREVTVPWGLHFPMCDDPRLTARAIDSWHAECVASRDPGRSVTDDIAGG